MTPKKLLTTAWASVEVPAKGEKEVEITVDAGLPKENQKKYLLMDIIQKDL